MPLGPVEPRRSDESSYSNAHAVRTSISGFNNDNAITPAAAVTAAESGDQTKICIANSAPGPRCPTSRKIKSNAHLARNRKNPFNARLSAKNTAFNHDAPNPTIDMPSAAAPNAFTARESATSPRTKPYTAADPGLSRTEPT